ncbi:hypothetical protein HNP46_002283 [Pseudomonas nitritireducens]|uniref:VCBS repeat-containing protein n=1 Tax=Pseudomonas nitroreducens TaxID=46680 RepID=A0A7W7P0F3_PSENT|nr:hypothetical protein [Pseudomonas nitritireducens]MBB4863436.1 hypothetical protein [Pseudomonas nitritireducens]
MRARGWGLLCLFGCLAVQAAERAYVPLTDQELANRLPMREVARVTYADEDPDSPPPPVRHFTAGAAGVSMQRSADGWLFQGRDKAGKPWRLSTGSMSNAAGEGEIYQADLDRNGLDDLVFWLPNTGVGLAPTAGLGILTFEDSGRPVYLGVWGYSGPARNGVEDLLDLKRDGHAQLLTMDFSEGYWTTSLYRLKAARWQRIEGQFGRLHYPVLTRFTHNGSRRPVSHIKPGRHPVSADISNDRSLAGQRYRLADDSAKAFIGQAGNLQLVNVPSVVIDDRAEGRTLTVWGSAEQLQPLFQEALRERREVELYGRDESYPGLAAPHTLWLLP